MMANRKKRVLSLLLAAVLAFSLLPITALATETANPTPEVTIAHNGTAVNAANGDTTITGQKTIAAVSGSQDQFDITLGVTTTSTSTTTVVTKPADVVLVMDVTESMDENGKWSSMKTAASSFIDTLLPTGNTTNRVAIVTYAGNGYKLLSGWQSTASTAKGYYTSASSSDALRGAIDGWSNGQHTTANTNGTNCQAGFLGADVQLDTARSGALQYVI